MKTTKTVTTVQKQYITNAGPRQKTLPTTTHVISQGGQSGLRHSLRGSAGGKIWKKTVLGDKFEYSKKLSEKRNYILYAHGMGHEKRQIEELEQIPQPPGKDKIVEETQLIDNYGYHETKNLKKKRDPKRLSITLHARLSSPFERTVVKTYSTQTSQPKETRVLTTATIPPFKDNKLTSINSYNSFTTKTTKMEKNKSVVPPKLFETYKPVKPASKMPSYSQTKTTTTKSITTEKKPKETSYNKYQVKTTTTKTKTTTTTSNEKPETITTNITKKYGVVKKPQKEKKEYAPPTIDTSKYASKKEKVKKVQQKPIQYNRPATEPKYKNPKIDNKYNQTKVETTQDGDYLIKITTTTTKKQTNEEKKYLTNSKPGYKPYEGPRSGSAPKGGRKPLKEEKPKLIERSKLIEKPKHDSKPDKRRGNRYYYGPEGPDDSRNPKPVYFGPHGTYGPGIIGNPQPFRPGDYLNKSYESHGHGKDGYKKRSQIKEEIQSGDNESKYTQKTTYQMKKTVTTGGNGKRGEIQTGTGKGGSKYSEYRRYEQTEKVGGEMSGINKSTENVTKYQLTQKTKYISGGTTIDESSKYQTLGDGEYIEVNCPVHGKRRIKKSQYKKKFN